MKREIAEKVDALIEAAGDVLSEWKDSEVFFVDNTFNARMLALEFKLNALRKSLS